MTTQWMENCLHLTLFLTGDEMLLLPMLLLVRVQLPKMAVPLTVSRLTGDVDDSVAQLGLDSDQKSYYLKLAFLRNPIKWVSLCREDSGLS